MDKKRRKNIVIGIVIVATLALGLSIYGAYQTNVKQSQLKELGALDATRIVERTLPSGELIAAAKSFTIYESEIKQIIDRNNLFYKNEGTTSEQAVQYLAELKSVYEIALDADYGISEEKIAAAVENDKKSISENNPKDFDLYVEAMGITADQYWELMLTDSDYHRELVIDNYLQDIRGNLLTEKGYEEESEDAQKAWDEELKRIGKMAIQQEDVRIVSDKDDYAKIQISVSDPE